MTASMRRLQEHKTMLLGRIAGFLPLPEENGKRMKLQARYCLHFSSLFSFHLLLHLVSAFPSTPSASSLCCPALPCPPLRHHFYSFSPSPGTCLPQQPRLGQARLLEQLIPGSPGLTDFSRNCSSVPFPFLSPTPSPGPRH